MCPLLLLKISSVIRYSGGSQPRKATTSAVKSHKIKEKPINQKKEEAGWASAPGWATHASTRPSDSFNSQASPTPPGHSQSPCCADVRALGLWPLSQESISSIMGPAVLLYCPSKTSRMGLWTRHLKSKTNKQILSPFGIVVAPRTYLHPWEEMKAAKTCSDSILFPDGFRTFSNQSWVWEWWLSNKSSDSRNCVLVRMLYEASVVLA